MSGAPSDFVPLTFDSSRGARITVRAIRPEDESAFHDAFLQLSSESRYSRFMSVVRDLTEATLDRATHPDGQREFALVAVVDDCIVAGGRYIAVEGTQHCEFAVTVVDAWQGHGLGGRLLTALKDTAAARGFTRMEGYVLSTNLAMRRLGKRLGFTDGPMPGDATTRLLVIALGEGAARADGA
jgi:RimJ/RimL family protein N-acetyltransferase